MSYPIGAPQPTHEGPGITTGLVTGDAVLVDMQVARVPSRMIAFAIDAVVQLLGLLIIFTFAGFAFSSLGDAAAAAVSLVVFVGVFVGYPVAFETVTRGKTLGKIALGLRVVTDDGGPERFRQALIRGLMELIEIWMCVGVIALFASLFSRNSKRLGDQFAGTLVVRTRVPGTVVQPVLVPPRMMPWAAAADLSRVDDRTALQIRQLLARTPTLTPQARWQLTTGLANHVLAQVAPAPPQVPPEEFLAAVIGERHRRAMMHMTSTPMQTAPMQATFAQPWQQQAQAPATQPAGLDDRTQPPTTNAGPFSAPM